jgi:DNA-binding response OmpR family regulator
MEETPPRVAVVNTSEEVANLLQAVLQMEGYSTARAFTLDFKTATADLNEWLADFEPKVVVWDIAIPYEENWEFFCRVSASDAAAGITFVVTTTNKQALDSLVGPTPTFEIIGKPFDLQAVIDAVRRALKR